MLFREKAHDAIYQERQTHLRCALIACSATFTRAQLEHGHVIDEFTKDLEKVRAFERSFDGATAGEMSSL